MANSHEDGRSRIDPVELRKQFPPSDPHRKLVLGLTRPLSKHSYGASDIKGHKGNMQYTVLRTPLSSINNLAPQSTGEFAQSLKTDPEILDAVTNLNSALRGKKKSGFNEASIIFSKSIRQLQGFPMSDKSLRKPDVQYHAPEVGNKA